ncbi:MAG: hypothetical protein WC966_06385 [Bradymonadales bacterium]|jgi:NurA-like 5'-3' nuclease
MKKVLLSILPLLLLSVFMLVSCDEESRKPPKFYTHSNELAKISKDNPTDCVEFGKALNKYYEANSEALKESIPELAEKSFYTKPINIAYALLMAGNIATFSRRVDDCSEKGGEEFENAIEKYKGIEGFNQALQNAVEYENKNP